MQNHDETAAAERVRIHLRRGLVKMLDNAQKRRELEPAQETSVLVELQKLKEVSLPATPSNFSISPQNTFFSQFICCSYAT